MTKKRKPLERKLQKELKERYAPVIADITSVEERDQYLRSCNDVYSCFILEKLESEGNINPPCREPAPIVDGDRVVHQDEFPQLPLESHHIIPRFCGGSDKPWNRITLSYFDHSYAHAIRYQAYGEEGDRLSLIFRTEFKKFATNEDRIAAQAKSLETRRRLQVGIHDPAVQSASGKKGGRRWTQSKRDALETRLSPVFRAARATGMTWIHKSGASCDIQPDGVQIPMDMVELLHSEHSYPEGTNMRAVPGALLKVIRGERQQNHGWRVEMGENVDLSEN